MKRIVLDTNCLLMSLPQHSPYRDVWTRFLLGEFELCISNEILEEYQEILAQKTTPSIASNVVSIMLNAPNICLVTPYYRFGLISSDLDDNKFVDCAISANAQYIVSEDRHFDVLKKCSFPKVDVIGIDLFVDLLKSETFFTNESDEPFRLNDPATSYGK